MARILVIGAGDIGGSLATQLAADGHTVWGLRRSNTPIGINVQLLQADVTDHTTLESLPPNLDVVVYSVASPAFTKESYHTHYYRGLRHILTAIEGQTPLRVFFVSSSSVYHQMEGEWVDENSPTEPNSFAGKEMLAAEQALLAQCPQGTVVRFTGIYGPGRTRMIEQARLGGHCDPEPPVWTNRIHRDDCIGVLKFLIEQSLRGHDLAKCYLATDDEPATLFDVLEWMKDRLGDVQPDHDMPEATRRANRRCSNTLIKASGYKLKYRNYREGYDVLLTEMGLA